MKIAAGFAAAALLAGVAISYYSGSVVVGPTMLAVLVLLPIIGVVITADDDLPEGFSNPDGDVAPPWRLREFWAELVARAAFSGIGFAIDVAWRTLRA